MAGPPPRQGTHTPTPQLLPSPSRIAYTTLAINETISLTVTTSFHDRTRTRPAHSSLHEATSKHASFKSNLKHALSGKITSLSYKLGAARSRVLRGKYGARLCMARMGGSIDSCLWNLPRSRAKLREGAEVLGVLRLLRSNWERLRIGSYLPHRFVRPPSPMSLHIHWAYTNILFLFLVSTEESTNLAGEPQPQDRSKTSASDPFVEGAKR